MPRRSIAPDKKLQGGPQAQEFLLRDVDVQFTLFLPEPVVSPHCRLTMHFHTAPWFIIQEHVRRGATNPLACFQLGEGSTVYRRAFEDRDRLDRCIRAIEARLREHSTLPNLVMGQLELSSFSAGYGAIREIVKSPAYVERIDAIILADSMYGAFETNAQPEGSARRPAREHIDPWVPFAQAAAKGAKTFVVSYSDVPTITYASSRQCAEALLQRVNLGSTPAAQSSATADPEFPLLRRTDAGGLHVWGYGGTNAQAHLTHVRHLADLWRAVQVHSR